MNRLGVKVKIIQYVDDSQPGWVRCVMTDAQSKEWFFTEKVPIVSNRYLDKDSEYPQEGILYCIVVDEIQNSDLIIIDTSKPVGIYSEDDKTLFTIFKSQLING